MKRVCVKRVYDAVAADTNAGVDVSTLTDLGIIIVYGRTAGTNGNNDLVCYGADVEVGTNKYLLGIRQSILGTLDADSALKFGASATQYYSVDGVHSCLYFTWDKTDTTTLTLYVCGLEDR